MATTTPERVGLLEACDDPSLLNFKLWPRQRDLLEAVERNRIHVWAVGRRSGKSTMAAVPLPLGRPPAARASTARPAG